MTPCAGEVPGVAPIWQQDTYVLPSERTSLGFKDGISHPAIEGSGIAGSNLHEEPFKAGEFVLGYPNEIGELTPMPYPALLGRNGSYVVFRKLQTRVGAFRQYVRAHAATLRKRSCSARISSAVAQRSPARVVPERDDPALGADPDRNNLSCRIRSTRAQFSTARMRDAGTHATRWNAVGVNIRLHRISVAARATVRCCPRASWKTTGPIAAFSSSSPPGEPLARGFEFVKTQWINEGTFIGAPAEKDPLAGASDGTGTFTIPQRPIRRRLQSLPPFVITRGGEYCFAPGLRALHWLAEPHTESAE